MVRQPANLRGDVARVEIAAGQRAQLGLVHASRYLVALSAGAAVAPDERGSERAAVRASRDQPVELRAERQRGDLATGTRLPHAPQGADQRPQPFAAVLLGPARPRIGELVRRVARGHERPVEFERLCARTLRTDVDADHEGLAHALGNVPASTGGCNRRTCVTVMAMSAAAPSSHPVARILRERADAGSVPGAREDSHRVALVLEGGGMRGVVSAGMVAALERLGMRDAFDLIVGSSAGAINGVALLSGVAQRAADAYCGPLASRSFVNPMRVLRGKPVIDVNDVLAIVTADDVAGHERVTSGDIALHCIATDVASATGVDLHGMRTQEEVWTAILASSRMPWAGGPPVEIDGRRYLDGGLVSPVPVAEAIAAGRHARARAADAPVRHSAQERVTHRRPSDRAASARSQSRAGDGVPRADRKLRTARRRPRTPLRRPRHRARRMCSGCGLRPARRASGSSSATRSCSPRAPPTASGWSRPRSGGRQASVAPR